MQSRIGDFIGSSTIVTVMAVLIWMLVVAPLIRWLAGGN